jgi:hypothetical protein
MSLHSALASLPADCLGYLLIDRKSTQVIQKRDLPASLAAFVLATLEVSETRPSETIAVPYKEWVLDEPVRMK